jgi:hypothetical protein
MTIIKRGIYFMKMCPKIVFTAVFSILSATLSAQSPKNPEKPVPSVAPSSSASQIDPSITASVEYDKAIETIFVYLKKGDNTKFNFLGPWSLELPAELLIEGYAKGATINKKPNTTTDDPNAMPLFKVAQERYELKVKNLSELKSKKLSFNLKYFFCRSDGGLCKINKKTVTLQM